MVLSLVLKLDCLRKIEAKFEFGLVWICSLLSFAVIVKPGGWMGISNDQVQSLAMIHLGALR